MTEEKQHPHLCPTCGLPFVTEDNLRLHIANWHSDESNQKQTNLKQVDPAQVLWHALVHQVYETPDGFQGLSESEKRYFAVGVLDGDVYNGGFEQYFFNNSGGFFKYALLGLEEMGAPQSLALLKRAKLALFDDENIPEDTGERRELILKIESDVRLKLLEELTNQYWKDPDDLFTKSTAYAKEHSLL